MLVTGVEAGFILKGARRVKKAVRKKPCPYCAKKLQAANKLKWRNNLSRHLSGGTCKQYEQERVSMAMRATNAILSAFGLTDFLVQLGSDVQPFPIPENPAQRARDVAELNRMMSLKSE